MKEQLAQFGLDALKALSPVILALLGFIGMRLNQWIAAKVKNEQVQGILTRLSDVSINAVKEVEQTFISTLEHPTAEDAKKARDAALSTIKSHMGARGLDEMKKVLGIEKDGDLEKLLITFLESHVHDLKLTKKAVEAGGAQ